MVEEGKPFPCYVVGEEEFHAHGPALYGRHIPVGCPIDDAVEPFYAVLPEVYRRLCVQPLVEDIRPQQCRGVSTADALQGDFL